MKKYYVYYHLDIDGNVFYVGRGTGYRAFIKTGRSKDWNETASKGFSVEIIKDNLTRDEADKLETELIENSSGYLVNKIKKFRNRDIVFSEVNKYFEYDEQSTSCLSRKLLSKNDRNGLSKIGPTGNIAGGYWVTKYNSLSTRIHRLIWVIHNKKDLSNDYVIDHIDGNSLNNNITNLRIVTIADNAKNLYDTRKNLTASGVMGVYWQDGRRWRVGYRLGGSTKKKDFTPSILYPDLPPEEAKQKAFEDAVAYRKQMEDLYYNKPE